MSNTPGSDADSFTLLVRLAEAWNRHDLDALMSMMSDDCVFEASAGLMSTASVSEGKQAVREAYAAVFEVFPDAHWAQARHFVTGNRAVSEWTFSDTQRDGKRLVQWTRLAWRGSPDQGGPEARAFARSGDGVPEFRRRQRTG